MLATLYLKWKRKEIARMQNLKKKHKKHCFREWITSKSVSEGRSMLEILGVLAIIAVLTITTLTGFQYLLNKHRANLTIHDVYLGAVAVSGSGVMEKPFWEEGEEIKTSELSNLTSLGYPLSAIRWTDDIFSIDVEQVPAEVCRLIQKMQIPSAFWVKVREQDEGCGTEQTAPLMSFYFDENLSTEVDETELCFPRCTSDKLCQQGRCVCPQGTHENKEEQCICDNENMMLINGQCQYYKCTGGTTGNNNWTCTDINGHRCGQHCAEDGRFCEYGMCQNECVKGNTYEPMNGIGYGEYYGCTTPDGITCTKDNSIIVCYKPNGERCGSECTNYGTCKIGLCTNVCPDHLRYEYASYVRYYGCYNPENELFCYNMNLEKTNFQCFKNNQRCGMGCDISGQECVLNLCADNCPEGTEYWPEKNACLRPDGVWCTTWSDNSYYMCYNAFNLTCAYCRNADATDCIYGTCEDDCPFGLTYSRYDSYYGCYDPETHLWCRHSGSLYVCRDIDLNVACGSTCTDYYAHGCSACLEDVSCPAGTTVENWNGNLGCRNSETNIWCYAVGTTPYCRTKENVRCGDYCQLDGSNCRIGDCSSEEANCPAGFSFNQIIVNFYGCLNEETGLGCYSRDGLYECYLRGTKCGEKCRVDGTECASSYNDGCL